MQAVNAALLPDSQVLKESGQAERAERALEKVLALDSAGKFWGSASVLASWTCTPCFTTQQPCILDIVFHMSLERSACMAREPCCTHKCQLD